MLWQDDVTQINTIMAQLQDMHQQLGRQNELLHSEVKLKEQQAQIAEKSRLYHRIAEGIPRSWPKQCCVAKIEGAKQAELPGSIIRSAISGNDRP